MTKPTQLFNEFETDHFEIKVGTKKIHIDTKNNLIRHGHQMSPVARIVNYILRQREYKFLREQEKSPKSKNDF